MQYVCMNSVRSRAERPEGSLNPAKSKAEANHPVKGTCVFE